LAAGPHPRRELTLMPRLGSHVLASAWPQALLEKNVAGMQEGPLLELRMVCAPNQESIGALTRARRDVRTAREFRCSARRTR
jgi:hypothetical protein